MRRKRGRDILNMLYVGLRLAKYHIRFYILSIIGVILWFVVVFCTGLVLSANPINVVRYYFPGIIAFSMLSNGLWNAVEYFRFYLYQGLTDLFMECGITILDYSVMFLLVDGLAISLITYILIVVIASFYINKPIILLLPKKIIPFVVGILSSIPEFILSSSMIGLLLASTPIEEAVVSILQFVYLVGTVIPPNTIGTIAYFFPGTIASELLRAGYGTNTLSIETLYIVDLVCIVVQIISAIFISRLCDRVVKKRGIVIRRG